MRGTLRKPSAACPTPVRASQHLETTPDLAPHHGVSGSRRSFPPTAGFDLWIKSTFPLLGATLSDGLDRGKLLFGGGKIKNLPTIGKLTDKYEPPTRNRTGARQIRLSARGTSRDQQRGQACDPLDILGHADGEGTRNGNWILQTQKHQSPLPRTCSLPS